MSHPAETLSLGQQAQSVWNRLWFSWRLFRQHQRPAFQEIAEPKNLAPEFQLREAQLREQFDLTIPYERATQVRYQEILSVLDLLTQLLPEGLSPMAGYRWLDVGAKNGGYLDAMVAMLYAADPTGEFSLTGIELDAYRLYPDWHSRMDYARCFTAPYPQVRYLAGDVMQHHERYTVISWILPFVFLSPCLSWGLPAEAFQPEAQLKHVLNLLEPGGILLIINQGEAEYEEQGRLLRQVQQELPILEIQWHGPLTDPFSTYRYPRFGWRCIKQVD